MRDHRRRSWRLGEQRDLAEEVARLERGDAAALAACLDRPLDEHEELPPLHTLRDQLRALRAGGARRRVRRSGRAPSWCSSRRAARPAGVRPWRCGGASRGQSYETGARGTSGSALEDAAGAAADPDARHPADRDERRRSASSSVPTSPPIRTRTTTWNARMTTKTAAASSSERRLKPRYQPISRAIPAVSAITAAIVEAAARRSDERGYPRSWMQPRTLDLHIDDLCARHGIRRVAGRGRAVVIRVRHRDGRTERRLEIRVPPVRGQVSYFVALHEIGHLVGQGRSGRRLESEEAAWRFALAEALVAPTDTHAASNRQAAAVVRDLGRAARAPAPSSVHSPCKRPILGPARLARALRSAGREWPMLYEVLTGSRQFPETDALERGDPIWSLGRIKRDQEPD